jgi:hypothetical protein
VRAPFTEGGVSAESLATAALGVLGNEAPDGSYRRLDVFLAGLR